MLTIDRLLDQQQRIDSGTPVFEDMEGRKLSRPEFAYKARQVAGGLAKIGFKSGDCASILALNSIRYLEFFFGVPVSGGIISPLNVRWSPAELIYALNDAGSLVLAVDDMFAKVVPAIRGQLQTVRHFVFLGTGPVPEGMIGYEDFLGDPVLLTLDRDPSQYAVMGYTGGTTGFPKGVVHTHKSVVATGLAMVMGDFSESRGKLVSGLPLFHIAGWGMAVARLLQMRSRNLIVPMFRPDFFRVAAVEHGCTTLGMVPAMMGMLLRDPGFNPQDYQGVREICYGASPISQALLEEVQKALPHVGLYQGYGMSEAGMGCFLAPHFHHGPLARPDAAGQSSSPLQRMRIEDEQGAELRPGEIGEVVFYGETIMSHYHNKPAETAAAFRNGGFRSGDAGYVDEMGVLFLKDRLKDVIVSGGENVYSVEVENAVASHPAVMQVAVVGVPDEEWGEVVHAVVVAMPGQSLTLEELRTHARQHIAGYKCPRGLTLVNALPLSAMNKVLKHELRSMLLADAGKVEA